MHIATALLMFAQPQSHLHYAAIALNRAVSAVPSAPLQLQPDCTDWHHVFVDIRLKHTSAASTDCFNGCQHRPAVPAATAAHGL